MGMISTMKGGGRKEFLDAEKNRRTGGMKETR